MDSRDWEMMGLALSCAKKAAEAGEFPAGAVVTDPDGHVLSVGYSRIEALASQTEHAEARALRSAGLVWQHGWRLQGCTLYATIEPCGMCANLAALSGIERIVCGLGNSDLASIAQEIGTKHAFNFQPIQCVKRGVRSDEIVALVREVGHTVARKLSSLW